MQILAVGAAVSMIILVATTSFEAKFGDAHVSKVAATAEQVSAAASWVWRLSRAVPENRTRAAMVNWKGTLIG